MIRKQLTGLLIPPGVGPLGVPGGVLHVLMAHPILHKPEFAARVQEVGGDGVLETMNLSHY